MADMNQVMAEMLARARPQQAPPPGHVTVSPGTGLQKQTDVKASINIGAIQKFFDMNEKKKDDLVDKMHSVYIEQGASNDPAVVAKRDQDTANPVMQKILGEAFKRGHAGVREVDVEAGAIPGAPPGTTPTYAPEATPMGELANYSARGISPRGKSTWAPQEQGIGSLDEYAAGGVETKKMYTFVDLSPSVKSQEAALMKEMPVAQKKGEALKGLDLVKGIGGIYGPEVERKLLNMLWLQGSARGERENKRLTEANDSWNNYLKQYGQEKELNPDDEAINYPANVKLASRAMQYISDVKNATGSAQEAVGAIDTWSHNVEKEINKPAAKGDDKQRLRRNNYIDLYTALLKKSGSEDIDQRSKLMDWALKLRSDEEVISMFEKQLGVTIKTIKQIYTNTKTFALRNKLSQSQEQAGKETEEKAAESKKKTEEWRKAPWYKKFTKPQF